MQNRNFDNILSAYLEFTANHESSQRIHLWTVISVLGALLERKVWMNRGYYTLYPNLYIFIIGKSGIIKKSTSTGIGVNLLRDIGKTKMLSDKLTASSLIDQLGKAGSTFEYGTKDVRQSALFAYGSELAVFMGEVFGSTIELLTTFYDCVPNDPNKPWVYKTKNSGTSNIFGPCLNILGASTQSWLKKCIPDSEILGGFTSRVLFVVENKMPSQFVAWPELPKNHAAFKDKILEDLFCISELTGEFTVNKPAKRLFSDWYNNHMKKVVPANKDERFSGYFGRKGDHILKLSMIHSVATSNNLSITIKNLEWGMKMLQSIERDMFTAFDVKTKNKKIKESDNPAWEVVKYMRKVKKIKQEDLMLAFQDYNQREIKRGIADLVDMDELEMVVKGREVSYALKGEEMMDSIDGL